MKSLVVKASVARDLARVLGKVAKKDDFYENDERIIDLLLDIGRVVHA